ncbi:MAG: acetyl-CoA carboxylase biotin carboxyl carrier protein [Novosphingobium sp.]|nr:acetyl-CoA carboxylase biotin carboxyl carrier protein [Novosphingobium sp.]
MREPELPENLPTLLQEFEKSGLRELHIRKGDFELHLSHDVNTASVASASSRVAPAAAAPVPQAAPVSPAASPAPAAPASASAASIPDGATVIEAPNLGTFYRSPKPGAPPYVEVGQAIKAGQDLCLIEVMKLFTALRSEISGKVVAVLVEDGAMVESGQPLFAVEEG